MVLGVEEHGLAPRLVAVVAAVGPAVAHLHSVCNIYTIYNIYITSWERIHVMLLSIISTLSTYYLHYQLGGDAGPVIAAEVPRLCHGRLEVQHLCARTLQLPP